MKLLGCFSSQASTAFESASAGRSSGSSQVSSGGDLHGPLDGEPGEVSIQFF